MNTALPPLAVTTVLMKWITKSLLYKIWYRSEVSGIKWVRCRLLCSSSCPKYGACASEEQCKLERKWEGERKTTDRSRTQREAKGGTKEQLVQKQILWKLNPIFFASSNPLLLHLFLLRTGFKIPASEQLKRILFRDIGLCFIEDGAIKTFLELWRKWSWILWRDEMHIIMKVENVGG